MPSQTLHSSLFHSTQREWTEPSLHPKQLIYPLFVTDNKDDREIVGFAPHRQWGHGQSKESKESKENHAYDSLVQHLRALVKKGLRTVMLFGVVTEKNATGRMADHRDTPVIQCVRVLRQRLPTLMICCDVCLCEYTDHGHCGVLKAVENEKDAIVDNAKTIERLAEAASAYARAGAHVVCPSDMMDTRVQVIRRALDAIGYQHVSIMAYTSKKASCMYGPFRTAVESTFQGDRKRYQHPVGSSMHPTVAYHRDVEEGADSVIVKPALFYADIIREYSQYKRAAVVAYMVSGEYKMLSDYGASLDCMENVVKEAHLSLLRAGANVIITYFTPYILEKTTSWEL